jgi:phenylpropionate dioxygenase-like ring-hydroxylating dioxygenase large terminal subunit
MTIDWKALPVPHAIEKPDLIPARRYYDAEFFELERELLWPRVWQMACRLEEIPNPGDYVVYDNLDQSVIVVRVDAGRIKAYHNHCRHRGVQLATDRGNCAHGLVCPFHGWSWDVEGRNTNVFSPEVFDQKLLDQAELRLRECRLETWGGCAFINFDDDAPALRPSIEPFASYHDALNVEKMRAEWWASSVLPVNWKLAMEAFMEGYHAPKTHPQLFARSGEMDYTVSTDPLKFTDPDDVIGSSIYFMKVLSEGMGNGMIHEKDIRVAEGLRERVDLPEDPAEAVIEWNRRVNDAVVEWSRGAGIPMPDLNDLISKGWGSSVNYAFPHYFLLPVYGNASSYRIRPLGPEETLFELWSLTLYPEGEGPEPPKTPTPLPPDDPFWPEVPAQDFDNLPKQQAGLHTKGFEAMRLAEATEGLVSNYQRLIDGYLAGLPYEKLLNAAQQVSGPIDVPIKDLGF